MKINEPNMLMSETFEDRVLGTIKFIRSVSEKELAEFIVHQSNAIEGLTQNIRAWAKVYSELPNDIPIDLKSYKTLDQAEGNKNFKIQEYNPSENCPPNTIKRCSTYQKAVKELETLLKLKGYEYWIEGKIDNSWYAIT